MPVRDTSPVTSRTAEIQRTLAFILVLNLLVVGVKVVVAQLHSHAGTTGAAKLALDMFSEHPPIDLCASLSLGLDRIG